MFEVELIDVITFSSKFAILNQCYTKDTPKCKRKHVVHLAAFLKDHFKPKEGERNDVEFHRILTNLCDWLVKTKSWENSSKVSLRLPDSVNTQKWSNVELDMLSEYITKMIKDQQNCFMAIKELDNVFGLIEWLVAILSQKYTNTHLKQVLSMFTETSIV